MTYNGLPEVLFFAGTVEDIQRYVPALVSEHAAHPVASPETVQPRNMYPAFEGSDMAYLLS